VIDPSTLDAERAPDPAQAVANPRPFFTLLDDGGGRFVVDPAFGVISLRDAAVLDAERGKTHHARLHVIEPSGAQYVLDMRLKLTGMVPQLVRDMPDEEELTLSTPHH
jgi:hypothetical protein